MTIKLTDQVITTDPVQETEPNREPSAQSFSEQREGSMSIELLPILIKGKRYDGVTNVEMVLDLGRLHQQLSELGVTDMTAAEPQEFKDALVYGEQARARTLGELV